jgi:hypothetical protein
VKIKVQVVIEYENEEPETVVEEISCLERDTLSLETLGLTLAEGKEILASIQEKFIRHQVAGFIEQHRYCGRCHRPHRRNGYQTITYRTLFGNLKFKGRRYYRCTCQAHEIKTFSPIAQLISERTAPEFTYLQAK